MYEVHQDYLGSVVAVVDPVSRTVVSEYAYDSFGRRTVRREGVAPGYGFTGQQVDAETGLGYFRMRYYDPGEGRFISEDPLGFPDGVRNAYTYVANAPYQSVDPFGLSATIPFIKQADDATTNDIYPSVIYGGALNVLLGQFNDVFELLGSNIVGAGGPTATGDAQFDDVGRWIIEARAACRALTPEQRTPAPKWLDPQRNNHGGDPHKILILQRINWLLAAKGKRAIKIGIRPETMRMNQAQVDTTPMKVSTCRPDIQYDFAAGAFHILEEAIYSVNRSRTFAKMLVMNDADPNTAIIGFGFRR